MKTSAIFRLITACSILLLTGTAHAQLSGSLFTQPEEREYLDYLRQQFVLNNAESGFDIAVVEIPDIPTEAAAAVAAGPREINFGGIMTRRDGSRSVWLNSLLLAEQDLPAGVTIVSGERGASLRIAQDGNIFVLRPGQTVDLTSGTVLENFQRPRPESAALATASEELAVEPEAAAAPEEELTEANEPVEETSPDVEGDAGEDASGGETADALVTAVMELDDAQAEALLQALESRQLEQTEADEESDEEDP